MTISGDPPLISAHGHAFVSLQAGGPPAGRRAGLRLEGKAHRLQAASLKPQALPSLPPFLAPLRPASGG